MKSGSALKVSVIAVAAAACVAVAAGVWLLRWLDTRLPNESTVVVVVDSGQALRDVAFALEERGLLRHPRLFSWYARLRGDAHRIHAGEYAIEPATTTAQLLARLVRGDVVQHQLRVLEGWTVAQLTATLARDDRLKHTLTDTTDIASLLGITEPSVEGMFFPDTYQFTRGSSDVELLRRAHERLESVLERAWAERDAALPYTNPYEVLIMASIVEKETGREDERAKIARVFVSRLERGMLLQTDPTVIYGLGEDFDGNLTRGHLKENSAYNTYRRRGLPPTPIALAGRASIDAAVHPAQGDYLYFVARGDGSSEFSATLPEHSAAVRRFQLTKRP